MTEWLSDPAAWAALATLTAVEIVLGVDNIVFISILVGRLPPGQRRRARIAGLAVAMAMRILLLFALTWVLGLSAPLFEVLGRPVSGRALILVAGGLFLLWKSVHEIHRSLEGDEAERAEVGRAALWVVLAQIAVLDVVFSLDSVITAVGLVDELPVMVLAIVIAVLVMMFAAEPIGRFVDRHPTIKMLALSFLVLIGFTLTVEGFGVHVPKGYIYVAMAFSVAVELLNLRLRSRAAPAPVHLRRRPVPRRDERAPEVKAEERAWLLDPNRAAQSGPGAS
jgi:predicted tellurium resistance membrane protein TerC